jgi:hypothetical protein
MDHGGRIDPGSIVCHAPAIALVEHDHLLENPTSAGSVANEGRPNPVEWRQRRLIMAHRQLDLAARTSPPKLSGVGMDPFSPPELADPMLKKLAGFVPGPIRSAIGHQRQPPADGDLCIRAGRGGLGRKAGPGPDQRNSCEPRQEWPSPPNTHGVKMR